MTPELLREIGEALDGTLTWQVGLGRRLGTSAKTIQRWYNGLRRAGAIPEDVAPRLRSEIQAKRRELAELARRLR